MELVKVPVFFIGLKELEHLGYQRIIVLRWLVRIGFEIGTGVSAEVVAEKEDGGFGFGGLGFKKVEEGF